MDDKQRKRATNTTAARDIRSHLDRPERLAKLEPLEHAQISFTSHPWNPARMEHARPLDSISTEPRSAAISYTTSG